MTWFSIWFTGALFTAIYLDGDRWDDISFVERLHFIVVWPAFWIATIIIEVYMGRKI